MKNVQIPYELFVDLVLYHLNGEDDFDEEIRKGLEKKLDAMLNRQLYSRYKTAPYRGTARESKAGVFRSTRSTAELSLDCSPVGAITGAWYAPVNGRQSKVFV